ncbi:MAG: hypothetical protein HUU10_12785 [Bacteroidetes bacterium]|nr:hypothetical protein [Bacteroidota bacterium]
MNIEGLTKQQITRLQSILKGLNTFPPIFGVYGEIWFALKEVLIKRDEHFPFRTEPDCHAWNPLIEYGPAGKKLRNFTDGQVIDLAWKIAADRGGTEIQYTYMRRVWDQEEQQWVDECLDLTDHDIGYPANTISKEGFDLWYKQ